MLKHVYWTGYRDDPNHMCNAFFVPALQQLSFYRFLLLLVFQLLLQSAWFGYITQRKILAYLRYFRNSSGHIALLF